MFVYPHCVLAIFVLVVLEVEPLAMVLSRKRVAGPLQDSSCLE